MRRDLIAVAALTGVAVASALASAPTVVTALLGIPVLLLAPGYVWLAALLPASGPSFERSVLTAGLSLIVLVLGGLALQVTGLPLDRTGWAGCLAVVVAAGVAVDWRRPGKVSLPRLRLRLSRSGVLLTLAGLVLAGAVTTAVIGARTAPQTHFTSLGLTATSDDNAVLQLHNAEGAARTYLLVVTTSTAEEERWTISVAANGNWSTTIDGRPGTSAVLYVQHADGTTGPAYRSVAIRTSGAGR
jgi:hypothetical protein